MSLKHVVPASIENEHTTDLPRRLPHEGVFILPVKWEPNRRIERLDERYEEHPGLERLPHPTAHRRAKTVKRMSSVKSERPR
jgi:hypothetical protein